MGGAMFAPCHLICERWPFTSLPAARARGIQAEVFCRQNARWWLRTFLIEAFTARPVRQGCGPCFGQHQVSRVSGRWDNSMAIRRSAQVARCVRRQKWTRRDGSCCCCDSMNDNIFGHLLKTSVCSVHARTHACCDQSIGHITTSNSEKALHRQPFMNEVHVRLVSATPHRPTACHRHSPHPARPSQLHGLLHSAGSSVGRLRTARVAGRAHSAPA